MGLQDLLNWRSKTVSTTATNLTAVADEDLAADVDEPPEQHKEKQEPDFHKSHIHFEAPCNASLLTQALKSPDMVATRRDHPPHLTMDLSRRRSMLSNTSLASTAELTSDGGLTSPARTNTPSPPPPRTNYASFTPFSLGAKPIYPPSVQTSPVEMKDSNAHLPDVLSLAPKTQPPAEMVPKKRCITFACGGNTKKAEVVRPTPVVPQTAAPVAQTVEPAKRECRIKFACNAPNPADAAKEPESAKAPEAPKQSDSVKRSTGRSPSATRKSPRPIVPARNSHRESTGTIRRASQSPSAVRSKPKFFMVDEATLQTSEASRFHEFASDVVQEDDWIRRESDVHGKKMTINDTLKMENAIRKLGNEAEEEALEEDENEEDDGNDSDNESGEDDEDNEDDEDGSEFNGSDGNESDNEAGFAESDDGSDDAELAFWTPGRTIPNGRSAEASTYRPSAHRTASASSIDSLIETSPIHEEIRRTRRKHIKIRPGTPDLPDSTDFVCGTLDEDRPLEDAYVSCMEARKIAKHKQTPQDIDPTFPTSDIDDEEDEHDSLAPAYDSDDHAWHQGKFEDSEDDHRSRRRSVAGRRKSPGQSPKPTKRLHSPPPPKRHNSPPAKTRLRSPPPRKLFGGHSPRRMRSPPPGRVLHSPPGSPTAHSTTAAIAFAPLGSRPGLTHTKSLPRTPNAFCRAYNAARLIAANGNNDENSDGHVRGAIDIVKGLEQKRQRRKEKFYQKQCNRKAKGPERRPQPGQGAERMREHCLGTGKTGANPYMMSA